MVKKTVAVQTTYIYHACCIGPIGQGLDDCYTRVEVTAADQASLDAVVKILMDYRPPEDLFDT